MSFGFLFLFLRDDFSIGGLRLFHGRHIPLTTFRHGHDWDAEFERRIERFYIFGKAWRRGLFALFYFAINCYIVVVPLIQPYVDGNNKPLEVQGTWYIAVVGVVIGVAVLYYYTVIGFTAGGTESHPNRSILRIAGVETRMMAASTHNSKYGYRRYVELTVSEDSQVSSNLLHLTLVLQLSYYTDFYPDNRG